MNPSVNIPVRYLLFNKAVADDLDRVERIERYLEMVEDRTRSHEDPVQRALATALEMAGRGEIDPWDVDLGHFASRFLAKVDEAEEVDLRIAGRIILLAFKVLHCKAHQLWEEVKPVVPEQPQRTRRKVAQTRLTGSSKEENPKPSPATRRPVSLIELLDALDTVGVRKPVIAPSIQTTVVADLEEAMIISTVAHAATLDDDLALTWRRIAGLGLEQFPFNIIPTRDAGELTTIFVCLLLLHQRGEVRLGQSGQTRPLQVELLKAIPEIHLDPPTDRIAPTGDVALL